MTRLLLTLILLSALLQPLSAANKLDPTLVVVLGGGLSAGFADFHLTQTSQEQGWASLAARQMGTILPLPTLRESGNAGVVNAFRPLPGLLPTVAQSGERALPFPFFALNLSVPFLRLADALRTRPQPLYDGPKLIVSVEGDLRGTLINTILGGPLLTLERPVLLTQAEYAEILNPTLVFVQLGFEDLLEAALTGNASSITPAGMFASDYTELVRRMTATHATVIVMTVPDPTDTAYFTSTDEAARIYGMSSDSLRSRFGLASGDVITLGGLVEIGDAIRGRRSAMLSAGSVLRAPVAAAIRDAVSRYNDAIRDSGSRQGVAVFDLGGFLRQVRTSGVRAGTISVGGGYGAGFYSEDGLFPGPTGQALIANAVLQFLNSTFGTSFAPTSVEAVAQSDKQINSEGAPD